MPQNTAFPERPDNPFIIRPMIPELYFCDREKETRDILGLIRNGNSVVLTSDRRIGKSSLIHHILAQSEVRDRYHTLYVDIHNTDSPQAFISAMKAAMANPDLSTFPPAFVKEFETVTREYGVQVGLGLGPVSVSGQYGVQQMRRDHDTVEKVFALLKDSGKKNIIVFDEFQQIETYENKITALLRSKMQMMPGTQFIFSGSSVHMLALMFAQYNQPFYSSSSPYGLDRIPCDKYDRFCHDMFRMYNKDVFTEAVTHSYNLLFGNTLQIQQLMNRIFDRTETGAMADNNDVKKAVISILEERDDLYRNAFYALRDGEKKTLNCVAMEGVASGMTSAEMIARYHLGAPSSILNHLKNLSDENRDVIIRLPSGSYIVADKFFELWVAWQNGYLGYKLMPDVADAANSRFLAAKKPPMPKMAPPVGLHTDIKQRKP